MSTNNKDFYEEIAKIFFQLSSIIIIISHIMRKPAFAYAKTKGQISRAVTA